MKNEHGSHQNILLAEYTLGVLDLQEAARAQSLLANSNQAVIATLKWESRFLELVDCLPPVTPPPMLFANLQATLGHEPIPFANPDTSIGRDAALDASVAASDDHAPRLLRPAVMPSVADSIEKPVGVKTQPALEERSDKRRPWQMGKKKVIPEKQRIEPSTTVKTGNDKEAAPALSSTLATDPGNHHEQSQPLAESTPGIETATKPMMIEEPVSSPAGTRSQNMDARQKTTTTERSRNKDKGLKTPPPRSSLKLGWPAPTLPALLGSITFWRAISLVLAVLALALFIMPKTPEPPKVTVVQVAPTQAAILQAPGQTSTPGWLLSIGPEGNVRLEPKVHTDVPSNASVQLWTHSKNLPSPRSLGLIDPNQPVTVPFAIMGDISPDQIFEMTQEEKDGSPSGSPSGPILFIGRVVTFGQ